MKIISLMIALSLLNGSVTQQDYEAPGIIGVRDNALTKVINAVYFGGPAYCHGVLPGDHIESLKPNTGKSGEDCILIVKRGKEKLTFHLRREAKSNFYEGLELTKDGIVKGE